MFKFLKSSWTPLLLTLMLGGVINSEAARSLIGDFAWLKPAALPTLGAKDGMLRVDSADNFLKKFNESAVTWEELVTEPGTQTLTNKTINGSSNTLTVLAATQLSGATPIANGGTGQTTQAAGFDALAPTTTLGDLILHGASDNERLAIGGSATVLTSNGTTASWQSAAATSIIVQQGAAENLGVTLAAGTFTIAQADGSALNLASGFVNVQSTTDGQNIRIEISGTDHFFIDDTGVSDIIGEQFGVSSGVAWLSSSRPFYLYVVNSDDTIAGIEFAISPNPIATVTPPTANIGFHGTPASTPSDENFFFLTATDVTTTHDAVPCTLIGGLRMTMSTSDDWTVTALDGTVGDGITPDPYIGKWFDFPTGQMGANVGVHTQTAGTPPTWTTPGSIVYSYRHIGGGRMAVEFITGSAGNAINGVGANGLFLAFPYAFKTRSAGASIIFPMLFRSTNVARGQGTLFPSDGNTTVLIRENVGGSFTLESDFSNIGDDFSFVFDFFAFINTSI